MPRFKWNNKRNGRMINKYIDTICRDFPAIAKDIVKHGVDDLDSWFSSEPEDADVCNVTNAKCGCLVGTTALVAMKRLPGTYRKVEPLLIGDNEDDNRADGALVLYRILVEKSKRDISKYDTVTSSSQVNDEGENLGIDPLLELIYTAGMAASSESRPVFYSYDDDDDDRRAIRHKQVVDHFENRIRKNLNIPYPKVKGSQRHA